uniref:hypothetical protein n=1 Tax=Nocardiopsis synnemataformans TaxID=61305 RepID=UPI003EB6C9CE
AFVGFKTWVVGEILRAADVNTYLAKQVIAVVTSGTRPPSPVEGQMIYETDTASFVAYTGSHWEVFSYHGDEQTYTPEWTAATTNPSIGNGTLDGRYRRLPGRMVSLRIQVIMGSTTNFGDGIYELGLPPGLPAEAGHRWLGVTHLQTAAPTTDLFQGIALISGDSSGARINRIRYYSGGTGGELFNWSSTHNHIGGDGDLLTVQLLYETATLGSTE